VGPAGQMLEDAAPSIGAAEHIKHHRGRARHLGVTTTTTRQIVSHGHPAQRWPSCATPRREESGHARRRLLTLCAFSMANRRWPRRMDARRHVPPANGRHLHADRGVGAACEWSGSDIVIVETCLPAHGDHTAGPPIAGVCPTTWARRVRVPRRVRSLMLATDERGARWWEARRERVALSHPRNGYQLAVAYETAATLFRAADYDDSITSREYGALLNAPRTGGVAAMSAVPAVQIGCGVRELELGSGTRASTTVRRHNTARSPSGSARSRR